ncbi:hypothetical protein BBJ28_00004140 [Nothophytophthora sp. Chile5]|nr:hypothetical protein BBJ28_00004140 [Nothophytophthora sp. Chile5]
MQVPASRSDLAPLLEENQRLRTQLQVAEAACRRVHQRNAVLERRIQQTETAAEHLNALQIRQTEADWMAEYDRNVQALLRIIHHHEEARAALEAEVVQFKAAAEMIPPAPKRATQATQTERPRVTIVSPPKKNGRQTQYDDEGDGRLEIERPVDTSASLVYMQHLFEQIQKPSSLCESHRVPERPTVARSGKAGLRNERCLRCLPHPSRAFKASVMKRLRANQIEISKRPPGIPEGIEETATETSQAAVDASAQEPTESALNLHQNLEERNRLLQQRLTLQQSVLDQLLHAKLQIATANEAQVAPRSSHDSSTTTAVKEKEPSTSQKPSQGQESPPLNGPSINRTPSLLLRNPPGSDIEQRRPLSPPAA